MNFCAKTIICAKPNKKALHFYYQKPANKRANEALHINSFNQGQNT